MLLIILLLTRLGSLCTILGASLLAVCNTLSIQSTANDVVTYTGKVLYTAAANQNNRVLLQIVADTGDVSGYLVAVGQAYTSDLTKCGVGLLRSRSTNCGADASLLGRALVGLLVLQGVQTLLHCGGSGLVGDLLSAFSHQLVKSGHCVPPFFKRYTIENI